MKAKMAFLWVGVFVASLFCLVAMAIVGFISQWYAPWDVEAWTIQQRAWFALGATVCGYVSFLWVTRD